MKASVSNEVLIALRRIIQAIDLHSFSLVRRYGLTGPQLVILHEVAKVNELSVGQLAKAISLGQATVTGILARLEKRGFINRRRCEIDKRKVLIQITEKGKETIEAAPSPLHETFLYRFERLKDWEQNMILTALQRVVSMMDAKSIDASPVWAWGEMSEETFDFQDSEELHLEASSIIEPAKEA
ncbi:MAG: MarR family transcriptional regulator [Desulfobacterales bacterium]|nr:MarR family transcriptional regulator [Desulfobacterales bacterium]